MKFGEEIDYPGDGKSIFWLKKYLEEGEIEVVSLWGNS